MPNVIVYVISKQWTDLPSKTTPIFAADMTHIEQGIKNVTDFVNTLNADAGLYLCAAPFTSELADKLDGIEANANNYSLPTASTSTKGGVKVDGITITSDSNGVISAVGGGGGSSTISGLTDVQLNQLADGEILKWDAESSKWVNASEIEVTTQLSALTDVAISSPSNGQYLKWDGTLNKWVNASGSGSSGYSETVLFTSNSDSVVDAYLSDDFDKYDAICVCDIQTGDSSSGLSLINSVIYPSSLLLECLNDNSKTFMTSYSGTKFFWSFYVKSKTHFQKASAGGYRNPIKIIGIKYGNSGGSSVEPPTYNETMDILEGE